MTMTEVLVHAVRGTHGGFTGRRYRRGRTRCLICGAPVTAKNRPSAHLEILRNIRRGVNLLRVIGR